MFRIDRYQCCACDGISRRTLLEAAGAGLFGLSLHGLLAAEARATPKGPPAPVRAVIFLFLFGGPSQLETFDLKYDRPAAVPDQAGPRKILAVPRPGVTEVEIQATTERLLSLVASHDCTLRDSLGRG